MKSWKIIGLGAVCIISIFALAILASRGLLAENWQWVITSIVAVAAIVITYCRIWYQKRQLHGSMLLEVFETLSTNESRKERGKIRKFYCANKDRLNFDNPDIRETADSVELAFEKVCVLENKGYLQSEEIKEIYGEMIVKFWKVLKSDIKEKQEQNRKGYGHYFYEFGEKLSQEPQYKNLELGCE